MQLKQIVLKNIASIGMAGLLLSSPLAFGQNGQAVIRGHQVSFLGVGLQEISSERAKELKLPEEAGVEITSVEPNSPAASAGLKTGDVVLQYNGQRVEGTEQFTRMVQETPAGRDVKLQVFRNGGSQIVTAKIGSHPGNAFQALFGPQGNLVLPANPPLGNLPQVNPINPRQPFTFQGTPVLGIQGLTLDGQLADYFGVKQGVLVSSVTQGSPADKAGIKAGDVITRVGDRQVATPADLRATLRKTVAVVLTRDHKEMTMNVAFDDGARF